MEVTDSVLAEALCNGFSVSFAAQCLVFVRQAVLFQSTELLVGLVGVALGLCLLLCLRVAGIYLAVQPTLVFGTGCGTACNDGLAGLVDYRQSVRVNLVRWL